MQEDAARLFTPEELRRYRYRCSHKLAVSLTIGALYLPFMTYFLVGKLLKGTALERDALNYGFAAVAYILLVALTVAIVRRDQTVNFFRFLRACAEFKGFENLLDYVEYRTSGPFPARFMKHPVHLMILGKVLERSEEKENAEAGRRMISSAAERDPALERFRDAPLADLMEYHKAFLEENPEMVREWNKAEKFHRTMARFVLPLAIVVLILAFVLKGCAPAAEPKKANPPAPAETGTSAAASSNETDEAGKTDGEEKTDDSAAPANGNEADDRGNASSAPRRERETGITRQRA